MNAFRRRMAPRNTKPRLVQSRGQRVHGRKSYQARFRTCPYSSLPAFHAASITLSHAAGCDYYSRASSSSRGQDVKGNRGDHASSGRQEAPNPGNAHGCVPVLRKNLSLWLSRIPARVSQDEGHQLTPVDVDRPTRAGRLETSALQILPIPRGTQGMPGVSL